MTDGIRWIRHRTMMGGGVADPEVSGLIEAAGPHRSNLRPAKVRSLENMFINTSDGTVEKRLGFRHLGLNGSSPAAGPLFGGTGGIRQIIDYMRPVGFNGDGSVPVFQSNNAVVGFYSPSSDGNVGFLANPLQPIYSRIRTMDGIVANFMGSADHVNGLPNETNNDRRMVVFNSHVVVTSHRSDPWVWNGQAGAGSLHVQPSPYPSNHVHDASWPVAGILIDRQDHWDPDVEGPFQTGDFAFYIFAYEIGLRFGNVPGFNDPGNSRGPSPSGFDIPHAALKLTYQDPVGGGSLLVPTPMWPEGRGVNSVRIYRSRIYTDAAQDPPRSLSEFFFIGRTKVSGEVRFRHPLGGIFVDSTPDEELGSEIPYGPPLHLYRARDVIEHNKRLVFANLKSPRGLFAFISCIPFTGRIIARFKGAPVQGDIEIFGNIDGASPVDPAFNWTFTFSIVDGEKLGDMVTRFNKEARLGAAIVVDVAGDRHIQIFGGAVQGPDVGGSAQIGDKIIHAYMILLGDPEVIFTSKDMNSFIKFYPDIDTSNPADSDIDLANTVPSLRTLYTQINLDIGQGYSNVSPSDIYITDIRNPFVFNPFLRFGVGEADQEGIWGMAKFRAASYQQQVLLMKRHSLFRLSGSGVERAGQVDYNLQEVTKQVGLHMKASASEVNEIPHLWTESVEGIYFMSYRGVEFFDGLRVKHIPISDDIKEDVLSGLVGGLSADEMGIAWYDGKVFISGFNKRGDIRMWAYDEKAAALMGDTRSSWVTITKQNWLTNDRITALGVWFADVGPTLVGGTRDGYLWRMFPGIDSITRDTQQGVQQFNLQKPMARVVFSTVEPNDGHRVRMRAVRPRFNKLDEGLDMEIKFDDRAIQTITIDDHVGTSQGDTGLDQGYEMNPLIWLGMSMHPRARRIQVALSHEDDGTPWKVYGFDVGYTPSEGSLVGATR